MKYRLGILKNEEPDSHVVWEKACQKYQVDYRIIEVTRNDWLERLMEQPLDCCLAKPPGMTARFKELYDERMYILNKVLGLKLYPSYEEIVLHENKRLTMAWLKAKYIPHIKTDVFYHQDEAMQFLEQTVYPIVAKTSLGSSGEGVKFLKSRHQALQYVRQAFSEKGIKRKAGPGWRQGHIMERAIRWLKNPAHAKQRIQIYREIGKEEQKGFVLFQEFIPHEFEWRAVRIGESYFAHKKIKAGDMCSGSKGIDYVDPPEKLLEFLRYVCDTGGFLSMAVDILEDKNGEYLVNELQTVFGHVQAYILEVDGKAGRYIHQDGKWAFKEGNFNTNISFDLRLEDVLDLLQKNKL